VSDLTPQNSPSDLGTPDDVDTPNPMEGLGVNVLVPDLEVRMVNAGALEEYEIWFGMSSVFAAAVVGFLVAYIQSFHTNAKGDEHSDPTLLVVALVFLLLFLGAMIRTIVLRLRIRRKSRSYPMRVTSQ
jgi:predicted permease